MTNETESIMIEEESGKRRNVQQQRWRCVPVVMSILVLLMLVLVAVTGRFTHSGELSTRGFYPKITNFAIKAENSSDRNAAMLQSMCERHEDDCIYNNPPEKKQPEEPEQPYVTETETVPMEASLLMKWMKATGLDPLRLQWQNKSAALPVVNRANWMRATHTLAHTSTNSTWSLQEKRVYVHWAEWAVQLSEETNWTRVVPFHEHVEKVKTELHLLQLQNLDAAPEGGDVSLMTGKPTTTAEKSKEEEAVDKEEEDVEAPPKPRWGQYGDSKEQSDHREINIHRPITYQ